MDRKISIRCLDEDVAIVWLVWNRRIRRRDGSPLFRGDPRSNEIPPRRWSFDSSEIKMLGTTIRRRWDESNFFESRSPVVDSWSQECESDDMFISFVYLFISADSSSEVDR